MSLRLEMLQIARLAPNLLGDSALLVRDFLRREQNADGGFKDRAGQSDLYYSVFGLDGLIALQAEVPATRVRSFLAAFGHGAGLDFVHLCCLARCWAAIGAAPAPAAAAEMVQHAAAFRSQDGGYNPLSGAEAGAAYGCFLAVGFYQDLGQPIPDSTGLVRCLDGLRTPDGAWSNARRVPAEAAASGSTLATAAAVTTLRVLGQPVPPSAGDWLLARAHPKGGFLAAPQAPLPDLLSTATTLHALAGIEADFSRWREPCLDFIDSLWTNAGAFHGHWAEDTLDCEYTYYGLLALGHLAV